MNSTTRVLVAATLAVFPMTLPAQAPAEVLRQSPPAPFPVPGDATAGAERSAASAAQQLLAQLPVVIRREADDRTGALQLHAVGRAYKASFHDGFRMGLPVGPTVATAPWLHWRTTAVLRGGVAQPLHEPVADVVDERRCEYDLGAVVEAYDVRPEGVEQTFVLREPGPGDLVVRGALGGDFVVAANEPRHGAVELRDRQGRRTLTYGAATAIDRNGETLPLETATSDGVIELRVPAAWLATAAYPIVVDPLLTPVLMWQTNYLDLVANTDIDRDDVNSSWNVGLAFDVAFSSVDYDSYFVLANDTYSAGHVIYSRASSGFEAWPKMAFVHAANQWALVFTQEWGPSQCYWRRHAGASTTNMSSQPATLVTSSSGEFQRRPVLGGTSGGASTGNYALLLRERDAGPVSGGATTEIWGSMLNVATGTEGTPFRLAGGGSPLGSDAGGPAVSNDSRDGGWIAAWQSWSGLTGKWSVQLRRVSVGPFASPTLSAAVLTTDLGAASLHTIDPRVGGTDGRYVVAFGTLDTNLYSGQVHERESQVVRAMRFDWPNTAGVASAQPSTVVESSGLYRSMLVGGVAYDAGTRSHWAVTVGNRWTDDTTLYVLGYRTQAAYSAILESHSGRRSAVAFDEVDGRFRLAYCSTSTSWPGLHCRDWVYPTQNPPLEYGQACAPGAIAAVGAFRPGSEFPSLSLAGAAPNAMALLLLATQSANIDLGGLGYPGCSLLVDWSPTTWLGALGVVTSGAGAANVGIPLPEFLSTFDLFAQWAIVDPLLPNGIGGTRGLQIEIR